MKNIVITGGTKGIGKALAVKFATAGFQIAICSRNTNDLAEIASKLKEESGAASVIYKKCDVSIKQEIEAFGDFILEKWATVDVLVNNAGIFIPGQLHTEEAGTLEKTMDTNLYSAYYLTRKLLPTMMERKKGHIFNICSTASIMAYINGGAYCISKHALLGMSKLFREELKPFNIKVTSVLPGATYTASWAASDFPPERFASAEDVAETIWSAWQLSPSAVVEEVLIRPMQGDIK
ncbi:MAG: SDR family oxidoreductase [Bacteroidia bacterium]